jgi:hypothetical protein
LNAAGLGRERRPKRIPEHFLTLFATFLLTIFLNPIASGAAVTIGPEASVPLLSSSQYHDSVSRQPDDGSVQKLNPPVFSWLYYENPALLYYPYQDTRVFNLQLTTNGNFSSLLWNYTTSNNFFNFLPSITNSDGSTFTGTNYWRVVYWNSNQSLAMGTSAVQTFTMPASAALFDRSAFGKSSYLISVCGTHPHMLLTPATASAFSAYLRSSSYSGFVPGYGYPSYTNFFTITTNSDMWTSDYHMTNDPNWQGFIDYFVPLAMSFWADTNQWYTNGILNYQPSVGTVMTNWCDQARIWNYDLVESYGGNMIDKMQSLAIAYDMFYPILTPEQRANVLSFLETEAQYFIYNDWYFIGSQNNNRYFTNTLQCNFSSAAKMAESHMRNDQVGLINCMAGMGESPILRECFNYFMGYYIAQFDPFQASTEGRGYSLVQNFAFGRQYGPWVVANIMFKNMALSNAPVYTWVGDMMQHQNPTGFRYHLDAWGQRSCSDLDGCFTYEQTEFDYTTWAVAACLMGRGDYLRQYRRNSALNNGFTTDNPWLQVIVPLYFPVPMESDASTNAFVDVVRGWAIASAKLPTDWDTYTNGVGFIYQARPSAAGRNNGDFSDGSVEMWAYGADITSCGAGSYEQAALLHNGLFVDGIGANNPIPSVAYPVCAKITGFTNCADYAYVASDITHALNITNWAGGGSGNLQSVRPNRDYLAASNARPYIVSVTRNIVFPHRKYWVIYDHFVTSQNAHFQWKWNVWSTNCTVNGAGFTYTATNNYNSSPVAVYVQHITDPTQLMLTNLSSPENPRGTNNLCYAKMNPFSGESYAGTNDWYDGPSGDLQRYWANTIWVQNKTATTNWHFLSVVYPVKPGQLPPTITRVDDNTVQVKQGTGSNTDTDTISFDPTTQAPTLNLSGPSLGSSRLAPPFGLQVSP